ncbi:MAG: sugar ABC transporter substrate-binding protein [Nakamurella sp.]
MQSLTSRRTSRTASRTASSGATRRSRVALLGGALAAVLATAACTGGGGGSSSPTQGASQAPVSGSVTGEITLQTWALTPKFTDYLNGVITDFQSAHPGATVKLVDQPGDGYSEKVLTQAGSGTLPDVVNLPPDIAYPLAKNGLLQDVSASDSTLDATYVKGAVDAYRYKGVTGVFGYPWYLNTDVDYWNKTMFSKCGLDPAKPPATTDELFTQAATMHQKCPDDYLMSRKPGLGDFTLAGVGVLNNDGTKFTFADDPKAVDLIQRYATAFQGKLMPSSVLNSDYLGNSTLFTQGKVAWTTGGATSLADFEKNNPSLKNNVAVTPALDIPPLYIQGISVSSKSKNLATAQAFAQFLTNAKNQEAFAHLVNIFPSTVSSQSDPFFSQDDGTAQGKAKVLANEALKTAKSLTPVEANAAMTTFLDQQIALAMKGDTTPQQALKTAQDKMNSLLANS